MANNTTNNLTTTADDAAFVDAYELRIAGGSPDAVPVQWRDEIEQMARIHAKVAALPMPEVSPAVRSVVLTAAAQVAAQSGENRSLWATIADFLLRPGPILVGVSAALLALAVAVRPTEVATTPVTASGPVAYVDKPVATPDPVGAMAPAAPLAPSPAAVVAEPSKPIAVGDELAPLARPIAAEAAQVAPDSSEKAPSADKPQLRAAALDSRAPSGAGGGQAYGATDNAGHYNQAAAADAPKQDFAQPPPKAAKSVDVAERADPQAFAELPTQKAAPPPAMGLVADNAKKAKNNEVAAGKDGNAADDAVADKKVEKMLAKGKAETEPKEEQHANQAYRAQGSAPAAKSPAPSVNSESKPGDSAKQSDNAGTSELIAKLREVAEKTTDSAKKIAMLKTLHAAAVKAGDAKQAQWAKSQLDLAEASKMAPAKPTRQPAAEPVQRAKSNADTQNRQ